MKTLPLALLALSIGSAQALEITYSQQASGMPGGSSTASLLLPLFDTSRPEIPDGATLLSVFFTIHSWVAASIEFQSNVTTPDVLTGSGNVIGSLSVGRVTTGFIGQSVPFSVQLVNGGGGAGPFIFDSTSTYFANNLENYLPATALDPVIIFRLSGALSTSRGNTWTATPIPTTDSRLSASVTYTYATVPDGGSTALLIGLGLLSLQRLKSRR